MSLRRKMVNSPNMADGPYSLICLTCILYFVSCAEAFAFAVLFSYFGLCYMTLWSQIMKKNIASTTSGLWPFVRQKPGKRTPFTLEPHICRRRIQRYFYERSISDREGQLWSVHSMTVIERSKSSSCCQKVTLAFSWNLSCVALRCCSARKLVTESQPTEYVPTTPFMYHFTGEHIPNIRMTMSKG